jgi:hypothetical protein
MITVIFFWIYSLVLFYLYGWFVVRLLERLFGMHDAHLPAPPIVWTAGLCAVGTLASLLSLFIEMGLLAHVILLGGALIILLWGRSQGGLQLLADLKGIPLLGWVLLGVTLLTLLVVSTGTPANPDSGIYHAQAIRWIETYRAVPGLGNIHTRFAYNSSWMVLNALMSFSFLGLRSLHLLPSAFFLVMVWYVFEGAVRLLRGAARPSDWVRILLLPLAFFALGSEVASPGTDFPAALLAWFVLVEWMAVLEDPESKRGIRPVLLVVLAAFAVTVKLSNFPLLLVALFPFIQWLRRRNLAAVGWLALLGLAVVSPWLIRNVVISGYLVYPVPEIDLFNFDWEIPREICIEDRETALAWARTMHPWQTNADVLNAPLKKWARWWFTALTLNQRGMVVFAALAPLGYALAALTSRRIRSALKQLLRYAPVVAVAYAGLIYWFFSAPKIRYGYGFLLIGLSLILMPLMLLAQRILNFKPRLFPVMLTLILVAYQGFVLFRAVDSELFSQRWALPADYPTLPTQPCDIRDGKTLWCAELYETCWYDPFPCVPHADQAVGPRGKDNADGFRNYDLIQ